MKYRNHLCRYAFVALAVFALCSCSHSHGPETETTYAVTLNFGGEYTSVTHEPLPRTVDSPAKYYAVNVLRKKQVETSAEYAPFCYGVFDNPDAMRLMLPSGYYYKFECTTLREDVDRIAKVSQGDEIVFQQPFGLQECYRLDDNSSCQFYRLSDLNKFIPSTTNCLTSLGKGNATVVDGEGIALRAMPSILRYYGELERYSPSNGTVTVDLKNASFAIKVAAPSIPDGTLTWSDPHGAVNYGDAVITSDGVKEKTHIFTIENVKACWSNPDNYYKSMMIDFEWLRESGMVQKFETNDPFEVKRNVMSVVTVNLRDDASSGSLSIREEAAWGNTDDVQVTPVY